MAVKITQSGAVWTFKSLVGECVSYGMTETLRTLKLQGHGLNGKGSAAKTELSIGSIDNSPARPFVRFFECHRPVCEEARFSSPLDRVEPRPRPPPPSDPDRERFLAGRYLLSELGNDQTSQLVVGVRTHEGSNERARRSAGDDFGCDSIACQKGRWIRGYDDSSAAWPLTKQIRVQQGPNDAKVLIERDNTCDSDAGIESCAVRRRRVLT